MLRDSTEPDRTSFKSREERTVEFIDGFALLTWLATPQKRACSQAIIWSFANYYN